MQEERIVCVTPSRYRKQDYAAPFLDFLPVLQLVFVNNRTSCTGLLTRDFHLSVKDISTKHEP